MKDKKIFPMIVYCVAFIVFFSCGNNEGSEKTSDGKQKTKSRNYSTMESSTKIAYESTLNGSYDIYTINADGTDIKQLTSNQGRNRFPSWSPDGSKIVFASTRRRRNTLDIFVMNADGTNTVIITQIPGWNGHPVWSPDGSRIAFETARDKNFEIFIMNADGSDPVNLTNNQAHDSKPCWSPDGSKILFVSQRDGNQEIYVMNADGSNQVNLTQDGGRDTMPYWSPDGTKIAYVSDRDHKAEEIVEMPSKDEVRFGPEYLAKAMKARRKHDIFTMNADGSNQVNITNYPHNDFKPTWSPDGKRISFVSIRAGKREIFTMEADGSDVVAVTNNEAMDEEPSWSPFLNK